MCFSTLFCCQESYKEDYFFKSNKYDNRSVTDRPRNKKCTRKVV